MDRKVVLVSILGVVILLSSGVGIAVGLNNEDTRTDEQKIDDLIDDINNGRIKNIYIWDGTKYMITPDDPELSPAIAQKMHLREREGYNYVYVAGIQSWCAHPNGIWEHDISFFIYPDDFNYIVIERV